jgi:hypothetical protein
MGREGGAGRQKIQNTTHEIDPILQYNMYLTALKAIPVADHGFPLLGSNLQQDCFRRYKPGARLNYYF